MTHTRVNVIIGIYRHKCIRVVHHTHTHDVRCEHDSDGTASLLVNGKVDDNRHARARTRRICKQSILINGTKLIRGWCMFAHAGKVVDNKTTRELLGTRAVDRALYQIQLHAAQISCRLPGNRACPQIIAKTARMTRRSMRAIDYYQLYPRRVSAPPPPTHHVVPRDVSHSIMHDAGSRCLAKRARIMLKAGSYD